MVHYRRAYHTGGIYFITLTLKNRRSTLLTQYIKELRTAFQFTMQQHPFKIHGITVLPDHIHLLMELPINDSDFSIRIKKIKTRFTRLIRRKAVISINNKGEANIWQRRFWEHLIRDQKDFNLHLDYIHINPVKHGLVTAPQEWPYSSFHKYVRLGIYPANWSLSTTELSLNIE